MRGSGPARHDLLRLTRTGWSQLQVRQPALSGMPGIRLWAEQGHPAVCRRPQPGDLPAMVAVAVALPLGHGRARLAFQVAAPDVAIREQPPTLLEVLPVVPDGWLTRVRAVLAEADRCGVTPRVFGSLMWQHVTGLAYLRPESDLDLIWPIARDRETDVRIGAVVVALSRLDGTTGPRLDGEIVVEGIGAVNWRELGPSDVGQVLVKTEAGVVMMTRTRFVSGAGRPC